jgi:3-methyl-2-oxobutanoate hydroxymethyltransferase
VRAREEAEADQLRQDANLLEETGCFALVLEKIPAALAEEVTASVSIPTIGIGAGGATSGQVLVTHDLLGLTKDFTPRFVRRYANLEDTVVEAVGRYIADVRSGDFPSAGEAY